VEALVHLFLGHAGLLRFGELPVYCLRIRGQPMEVIRGEPTGVNRRRLDRSGHVLARARPRHHQDVVIPVTTFARNGEIHLASFGRVILFDRRGTGLSDPTPLDRLPDLETQVEDALGVLDAAGVERAAVLGLGDGGPVAMLLAAMHPERCSALVLFATAAKRTRADDYLWGFPETMVEEIVRDVSNAWISGDKDHPRWLAPSRAADERFVD
jgi:hypothetical protein